MKILVVDLLGGLGDLVMVLPSVHALAEHHPGAELSVLTHAPGAVLLARDPAVHAVRTAEKHDERRQVLRALADLRPDLVVTTTRFDGIGDLVDSYAEQTGARAVANLWRSPPADELVGQRYLRILAAEGVVDAAEATAPRPPRVVLGDDERVAGRIAMRGYGPRPTVLVPDAGMAVKRWPAERWAALAGGLDGPVLSVGPVPDAADAGIVELPPADLRGLAARFAAVGETGGVVVGPDTGPVRLAAAVGARTVALFGPTLAARYGLEEGTNLQGLPGCPHRRPTAITEQVCWWDAGCPLTDGDGPACLHDLDATTVRDAVTAAHAGVAVGTTG